MGLSSLFSKFSCGYCHNAVGTLGVARAGTWHTPDVCDCDQAGVVSLVLMRGECNNNGI